MRGKWIRLSGPRRFLGDLLHFAAQIPSVPVQRRMALPELVIARNALQQRPCWPAVFLKAYAHVCDQMAPLRRAYVCLPWPHLREYPKTVASIAVEREFENEPCVFFGRITNPASLSLEEVHANIRRFAVDPIESVSYFRKMLSFARWPGPLRRALMWLGLNLPGTRAGQFGTFGLSVYSSLGAESLHPLSPLTTTLNYGIIAPDGTVSVRLVYDHRVLDGATAARALGKLEETLNGPILLEMRRMAVQPRLAA
jgi:2-oxoacid dehydrogenase/acyltransferase catalytic subunit